jgi:hypothetical protein
MSPQLQRAATTLMVGDPMGEVCYSHSLHTVSVFVAVQDGWVPPHENPRRGQKQRVAL